MVEDLLYHGLGDEDVERVEAAFKRLGPTLTRWPTPHVVIAALPRRRLPVMLDRKETGGERLNRMARGREFLQRVYASIKRGPQGR